MRVEISQASISISEVNEYLAHPEHGAHCLFTGVVRNHNHGKKVLAVSYDAFVPMVEQVFRAICQEAQRKWGNNIRIVLIHRLGRLEVGELSIVIGVSSAHRDESYLASRYIIENVKHRAPIWKKEHYEEGDTQWLEGHALCGH
jgi:molybdopterin synthase catalytic subunit